MADKKNKQKRSVFFRIINFFSFLIAFILVSIPVFFGVLIYFNTPIRSENLPYLSAEVDAIKKMEDGTFHFDVRRGETSQSVGRRLERAGLIRNRYFWNLISRIQKEHIKSGTYSLELPISPIAIHRLLVSGNQVMQRVTFREGITLRKMARILEDSGICSAEDFLQVAQDPRLLSHYNIPNVSMEGYLFPDTYFFPGAYPAEQIIRIMADNFFDKIENIDPSLKTMSAREFNEKVIIASIVEREYRIAEEAPLMAGVFYNRLRINMGLQSCATVEYVITEILLRPHPGFITGADLDIRNPYNTYMWSGLPPGPISSPGEIALRAAFYPEETEFFYFRLDDLASGRHYFSRTLDEHIRAGRLIPKGW